MEVPNPVQLFRKILFEIVEVESNEPTVSCDVVAMRVVPRESDVMMEFGAKDPEFVPPLATVRVPVIVERVVVAVHVGTPETRARTCPSVPADVVDNLCEPLPRTTLFA